MPAVQQLHKAGLLTVALFSSDLWGDTSGNSDYDANTQHDDSDSSSNCGSIMLCLDLMSAQLGHILEYHLTTTPIVLVFSTFLVDGSTELLAIQ